MHKYISFILSLVLLCSIIVIITDKRKVEDYELCQKSAECLQAIADQYDLKDLREGRESGGERATQLRNQARALNNGQ